MRGGPCSLTDPDVHSTLLRTPDNPRHAAGPLRRTSRPILPPPPRAFNPLPHLSLRAKRGNPSSSAAGDADARRAKECGERSDVENMERLALGFVVRRDHRFSGVFPLVIAGCYLAMAEPHINPKLMRTTGRSIFSAFPPYANQGQWRYMSMTGIAAPVRASPSLHPDVPGVFAKLDSFVPASRHPGVRRTSRRGYTASVRRCFVQTSSPTITMSEPSF